MRSRDLAPFGGAVVALLLASAAWAEQPNGWYSAFDAGAHWDAGNTAHSSEVKPNGLEAKWRLKTNEPDWALFGRLGYRFDPHWRAELEVGWRNGGLKSFHGSAAQGPIGGSGEPIGVCGSASAADACDRPRGYNNQLTGMFNVIYDIIPQGTIHPFIGGGVGIDWNKARVGGITRMPFGLVVNPLIAGDALAPVDFFHARTDTVHFAWQVLGGTSFDLNPQLAIDLTYRFMGTS